MSLYTKTSMNREDWTNRTKPDLTSPERRVQETIGSSVTEMINRLLANQLIPKTSGENYHGDEKQTKSMLESAEVAPRYASMSRVKQAERTVKEAEKALKEANNGDK